MKLKNKIKLGFYIAVMMTLGSCKKIKEQPKDKDYVKNYSEEGLLESEGRIIEGEKEGKWIYYATRDDLEYARDTLEVIYYHKGIIEKHLVYSYILLSNNIPPGVTVAKYCVNEVDVINEENHGKEICYYESGKIRSIVNWEHGEEIDFVKYFENGNKDREYKYKNRRIHGLFKSYYIDGKIKGLGEFNEGKGDIIIYDTLGNKIGIASMPE